MQLWRSSGLQSLVPAGVRQRCCHVVARRTRKLRVICYRWSIVGLSFVYVMFFQAMLLWHILAAYLGLETDPVLWLLKPHGIKLSGWTTVVTIVMLEHTLGTLISRHCKELFESWVELHKYFFWQPR